MFVLVAVQRADVFIAVTTYETLHYICLVGVGKFKSSFRGNRYTEHSTVRSRAEHHLDCARHLLGHAWKKKDQRAGV